MRMASLTAEQLFDLRGIVAVVTGGATGIGLMISETLAANGARVWMLGRRLHVLESSAAKYGGNLRGSLHALQCDVTSMDSIKAAVKELESQEGKVHVLVNNSGSQGPLVACQNQDKMTAVELATLHLTNETFRGWDETLRVNTTGAFFTSMAFLPLLAKGNASQPRKNWLSTIINISSVSGRLKTSHVDAMDRQFLNYAYKSSKAAMIHLTAELAHQLNYEAKLRIRVNCIEPGLFPSPMSVLDAPPDSDKFEATAIKDVHVPAERIGEEDDMASAILFIVANTYVNGQSIAVDGGWTSGSA